MADFTSRLIVLTLFAFCVWAALSWWLRRANGRAAAVFAAIVSWAVASATAPLLVGVLRRSGLWPLV